MVGAGRPLSLGAKGAATTLPHLIRSDQLAAVRRSVLLSIPVNVVLGITSALVAWNSGQTKAGLIWFAASCVPNSFRMMLCRLAETTNPAVVDRRLKLHSAAALSSGLVWAFIPTLCAGYTSPQTLFYLIVVCGITAGAVTHGFAYARIPIGFITPPLLSAAGCLFYAGGFDRICLGATVVLYLAALIRACREGEGLMRETSRLKNEATSLATSLEGAHVAATEIAEEMTRRASRDALTGLLNRSGFLEEAERRAAIAQSPMSLLLLDLDGFKAVNDTYGHKAGDNVLIEVARRLQLSLPSSFAVARLGGDEFAVLFEMGLVDVNPTLLAHELIAAIAIPFAAFDAGRIGVSIGVHVSTAPAIDEMLISADAALYAAKLAGRNRCYVFDAELAHHLAMRRDIERDLGKALAEGGLEVWYQPVMIDGGARFGGFEALARWRHPRHGWISPPDLIASASLAGFGEQLLRFILSDVCVTILAMREIGLADARVAMNVSPREMSQIAVDELVLKGLKARGVPPAMLEIEITEETALDIQAVRGKLAALSEAGVSVAIDDFGVGYSSLGALRRLRVDRVKIDRIFVEGVSRSAENRSLVLAILSLAGPLGFEVVAEGIEHQDDLETMRDLGCKAFQGYLIARPMPRNEALRWARTHARALPGRPAPRR
ncbi:putative bifunctional diguanylate cyclase/phosphodiesterase [Methylopila sp. Yamaguchi]|uniref:putative bifunctional diguanylate cyclase/phosphodiesterase n=1 Tax=Methylopila sp. Yamaguchi TaxID=1437817 RepID=UPI000CCBFC9A|nr:EAL domain-containing protein [Methylopila sp. Yamaguchi]